MEKLFIWDRKPFEKELKLKEAKIIYFKDNIVKFLFKKEERIVRRTDAVIVDIGVASKSFKYANIKVIIQYVEGMVYFTVSFSEKVYSNNDLFDCLKTLNIGEQLGMKISKIAAKVIML